MAIEQTTLLDHRTIVDLIERRDARGAELLYYAFMRGLRYLAVRSCPEFADDCVQETFVIAISNIQRGMLKSPEALPGYIRRVLERVIKTRRITERRTLSGTDYESACRTHADFAPTPAQSFEERERLRMMRECILLLSSRERDILTRFYFHGQSQEQICAEMSLNDTQFRLLKSRSKRKLEDLVQRATRRTLSIRTLSPNTLRSATGSGRTRNRSSCSK